MRNKDGLLKTDFKRALGKVSYHIPCHSRVQNIGQKTREVLELVPDTEVNTVERCCGPRRHVGRQDRVFRAVDENRRPGVPADGVNRSRLHQFRLSDRRSSDRAGHAGDRARRKEHPLTLLRIAYGL